MLFKDITGQQIAKANLIKQIVDHRISHAQLISGQDGWGGLPLAIAYAQYINCNNKQDDDSCGKCPSCLKYNKLSHPDLHFVYPVATSKKVSSTPLSEHYIEEWRELFTPSPYFSLQQWFEHIQIENKQGSISVNESQEIIKKLNLKSYEGGYKIVIIWHADKMNIAASNKLLKLIEEPPDKTLFLLIAQDTNAILKTILSRTQLIKLNRIDEKDIAGYLTSHYEISSEHISQLTQQCDGDMIRLAELLNQENTRDINIGLFKKWMRFCYKFHGGELVNLSEELASLGREKQKIFLAYAQNMLRQCLVLNNHANGLLRVNQEELEFIKNFSAFVHHGNIFQLTEELNTAHFHIERNANPKILFMDLSVKVNALLNLSTGSGLI
jgi:DNA polymerase-3 subunit delta'